MEILDLIDRLEELVETGARVPWTGKSLVDAEAVAEVIDRLRASLPTEVQEAHEIRSRGEAIVGEAVLAAKKIRSKAEQDHQAAVAESAIAQEAQARADEIKGQAEREAQQMRQRAEMEASTRRQEADSYAEESLGQLRDHLASLRERSAALEACIAELERSVEVGVRYIRARWERPTAAAPAPTRAAATR